MPILRSIAPKLGSLKNPLFFRFLNPGGLNMLKHFGVILSALLATAALEEKKDEKK
jgi:hypothetical protein